MGNPGSAVLTDDPRVVLIGAGNFPPADWVVRHVGTELVTADVQRAVMRVAANATWPARKVERVLGTLALLERYGAAWPAWSPRQRQRRMAELRQLGLQPIEREGRVVSWQIQERLF